MSTKQIEKLEQIIEIPDGVEVTLNKKMLQVKGKLGKTYKNFKKIPINIEIMDGKIKLNAQGTRKRDYAILNTARSIVRNLMEGIQEGYTIKMKVVYAHFPITVKTKDNLILIDNFQGERSSRIAKIVGDTKVNPKGEDVIITGPVLTDVSQTAANLQQNTKVKNKDHRVFLDGIYIYEKNKGIEK